MGKYCTSCGKSLNDDEKYCHYCGAIQSGNVNRDQYCDRNGNYVGAYKKKSEGLALILSLLIPGLGQMYIGKIVFGLVLLMTFIGLSVLSFFVYLALPNPMTYSDAVAALILLSVILILSVIVWIYGFFSAYKDAIRYNEKLVESGHPPW